MLTDIVLNKKIFVIILGLLILPLTNSSFAISGSINVLGHDVKYNIENGQISNIVLEPTFVEILIDFVTTGDGFIEVTIPRTLLDAKLSETQDDIFFVIVNGFETEYIEIASNSNSRTIVIPFFNGDTQAEIIGTDALFSPVIDIPDWVRNNAGWWADDQIADADFVSGIQYLISKGIMTIPDTQSGNPSTEGIPDWVKNNAGWWAEGKIGDSDFVSGIQYLITKGILLI
jgi:hypothetical protein